MMPAATPCGAAEKQRAFREAAQQRFDLIETAELEFAVGAAQVRESAGDRGAGLAVGEDGRHLQVGMSGDQPQQLPGHVTGAPRAQWRAFAGSRAGHLGFAHVAQSELRDQKVAEIRRIADGVERLHFHLVADDVDADEVVGGGPL